MLGQEEEINKHAKKRKKKRKKERESTWQHVAMKMYAKGRNITPIRARQVIWGGWQKCPPCA